MILAEDAAADVAESRQACDVDPCRCQALCGPTPFELRVARYADRTFAEVLGGAA